MNKAGKLPLRFHMSAIRYQLGIPALGQFQPLVNTEKQEDE